MSEQTVISIVYGIIALVVIGAFIFLIQINKKW